MKNILHKSFLVLSGAVVLVSCKPTLTAPTPTKGNMDPTRYVALGSSMTAGYADGGLYYQAQQYSYGNLLASQFKLVGGGNFNQPLVPSSSIGCGAGGSSPLQLGYAKDCLGATSLIPVPIASTGDVSIFSNTVYGSEGPFNNMGVPGAKLIAALLPGYGNPVKGAGQYNPFFYRMAANPATSSILSDAVAANPTFFTLFFTDDVLTYAMAGAASDSLTSTANFTAALNLVISSLVAKGAKGAIASIPDVTQMPFFTTIPYNGLALDSSNAALLNLVYNARNIYFHVGNNPFLIQDPSAPYGIRLMQSNEHLLLTVPLDSVKCDGMGSYFEGIPNQYVLTTTEITNIQNAIANYNSIIQAAAQANGLAYVDLNGFFNNLHTGITYNGVAMNEAFVTGGTFSLDGINLNPIGNAMLANQFIKAINKQYGSTIPQVDATQYRGVVFP
jgi:hypothetical protein